MERSARPPPAPAAEAAPRPATREDLRGLRRWVAVACVWAVAASAIAVIALLDARNAESDKAATDVAGQLGRVQRQLGGRLSALEKKVDGLPRTDDVKRLEDRLRKAEDDAQEAADDAQRAAKSVTDLEQRVSTLESAGGGNPGNGKGQGR
jgi:Skp family chaperone for outer membrane proteins